MPKKIKAEDIVSVRKKPGSNTKDYKKIEEHNKKVLQSKSVKDMERDGK